MATRNIEAIEHRGAVYVRLDDLETYLRSLTGQAASVNGKDALHHVLSQLATTRTARGVR